MESIFRFLVVASALLSMAFWSIPYIDYLWLTYEQMQILDLGGFGAIIPTYGITYWGTLVTWLAISAGLFFYVNAARTAFVVFMIINVALGLFYGISIMSPLEILIGSIIAMVDGAIITMMYLTSISGKFSEKLGSG